MEEYHSHGKPMFLPSYKTLGLDKAKGTEKGKLWNKRKELPSYTWQYSKTCKEHKQINGKENKYPKPKETEGTKCCFSREITQTFNNC